MSRSSFFNCRSSFAAHIPQPVTNDLTNLPVQNLRRDGVNREKFEDIASWFGLLERIASRFPNCNANPCPDEHQKIQ